MFRNLLGSLTPGKAWAWKACGSLEKSRVKHLMCIEMRQLERHAVGSKKQPRVGNSVSMGKRDSCDLEVGRGGKDKVAGLHGNRKGKQNFPSIRG